MNFANIGDGSGDAGGNPNEFLRFVSATGNIARVTVTSITDASSVTR